ncbi:MAG: hypothetical protein COB10_12025 [Planctomycetota bacterium]|jgi:hypothetical protein|nr:MAG: hypothetical protein COB10_12025 [Planctomycetota bacterium]
MYFSSPGSQLHAAACKGRRVLLSFATWSPWIDQYIPSFKSIMLDSGAFSTLNSGVKISLPEYIEWVARYPFCDSWAGLDDISGDFNASLTNYTHGGFPTYHTTDPPELLPQLISIAKQMPVNGNHWIGIGMLPPRTGFGTWLRETLEQLDDEPLHVHGWALGSYLHEERLDSYDSTNWFRDAFQIRSKLPWLTYAEALDISILRLERRQRIVEPDDAKQLSLLTTGTN